MERAGTGFWAGFVTGSAAGASVALLTEPHRGRRRRAMLKDRAVHLSHVGRHFASVAARDSANRLRGTVADARNRVTRRREEVRDDKLAARVKTRLGRVAAHPHAVCVTSRAGTVLLEGPVLESERAKLLREAARVPGVRHVEDGLEPHAIASSIPALQGNAVQARRSRWRRTSWMPATRLSAVAGGSALALAGLRNRTAAGPVMTIVGAGLALRGATGLELRRLLGLGGRRGIDIRKNLHVSAPPEEVYRFWRSIENFPLFMSHVHDVQDLGNGRSRWEIGGPLGAPLRWTAEITKDEPNQVLAWKSADGSIIRHAGIVRFKGLEGNGTEVEVHMTYNPPGGAIAHALASAFRSDPKTEMDDDLMRMKSLIEEGRTTAHGEKVHREQVMQEPPQAPETT